MRLQVTDIMKRVATTVNQEATAPTTGSAEYELWLEYINRGVMEWSEANDWESMRKIFFPEVTGVSVATVLLPLDFKKLAAAPRLYVDDRVGGYEFPEIIEEQGGLQSHNSLYITQTGNYSSGIALIFNPATLASGASLAIPYYSMPTSISSPTEVPIVDDAQFLVDRTIAYILEARSDARFQIQENRARERLLMMIENANLAKYSSYAGPNPVIGTERRAGFRIGRD